MQSQASNRKTQLHYVQNNAKKVQHSACYCFNIYSVIKASDKIVTRAK